MNDNKNPIEEVRVLDEKEAELEDELADLEKREVELKSKLADVKSGIHKILVKFPIIRIDSWDGAGSFEDGRHVINTSVEKVRGIEKIESGYRGNFVIFESQRPVKLEEYFTQDEVKSIIKR
ncbi:hypothetical protein KAU33_03940 [Candidatus Dependentiae bacterium]|nr:hypothetical protein [Candidatus Dependentiae bacterium]